jgi:putative transposase
MARQLRIEFAGALYQVMSRGNRGDPIFNDDEDRAIFLKTLAQTCEKTGWHLHAYVLLGNHYHLLIETREPNLVAGMKWLQGTYTRRYNARHLVSGHLFQGRYRALIVDNQENSYLGAVSTYIHLNPARAGLVTPGKQLLRGYRWSSFPEYLKTAAERPLWLQTERVLSTVTKGADDAANRLNYETYLEAKTLDLDSRARREDLEAQWKLIRRGWCLGGKAFRENMIERAGRVIASHRSLSYTGPARTEHGETGAAALLASGLAALELEPKQLASMAKGAPEKRALAWWLRKQTTVSRRWICDHLAMGDESWVTHGVREMEQTSDPRWVAWKQRLSATLTAPAISRLESPTPDFLD